jgi:hypothetical protein
VGSLGWNKGANGRRLYFRIVKAIWNPSYPFIGGRLGEWGISGAWINLCSPVSLNNDGCCHQK